MHTRQRFAGAIAVAAATLTLGAAAPASAAPPTFLAPFACGQTWTAGTFSGHNPANSVDWNFYPASQEEGKSILASRGGTVVGSGYATNTGYGNFIEIDHGGGWHTFYAHLASRSVRVGDRVTTGQKIGVVGHTSAKANLQTHLHYEQRLNGHVEKAIIAGDRVPYFDHTPYTSTNACQSSRATGVVDTDNVALTVRQGPGQNYPAVGSRRDGAKVTIYCQTNGAENITGTRGTSRLWDRIGDGQYISDAYVNTGSMGRVAPAC
ncbi:M23 family metallopeptidase [Kineococcus sp. SYSU DK003]|uniref:M23 family metallopeptidase n=1 Tax=Kineococcus sp. SYSU DK003 TaxID=3383124 RepID=UPI003D7DD744